MNDLLVRMKVLINDCIHLKAPVTSNLGMQIIEGSPDSSIILPHRNIKNSVETEQRINADSITFV